MKKTSFANYSIVIGLLILCVLVLLAVYATVPETVTLLEENFNFLDDKKWSHEVSECKEAGEEFQYVPADENNRLTADGVLHFYPNFTDVEFRSKRNAPSKCFSCIISKNSTSDCNPFLFSAKIQSKSPFNASRGRLEIRAKLCCGDRVQFYIGMVSNHRNSAPDAVLKNLQSSSENNKNGSGEVVVLFESVNGTKIMKSSINGSEYRTYEINWDKEKISLNIDSERVNEEKFELVESVEEYFSNTTSKLDSAPITKPVYLLVGVNFEEPLGHVGNHSEYKRSLDGTANEGDNETGLEVDYIKVYEISS